MQKPWKPTWLISALALATILSILLLSVAVGSVFAQTSDTNCIYDASGGLDNCTAMDFGLTDIELLAVNTPCTGLGSTANVTMRLTTLVGSPERYDVGYFISTDGSGDAINGGACYHTYLQPLSPDNNVTYNPIGGPYWQGEPLVAGDMCADSEGNNVEIVFDTLESFDILCVDTDNDGAVDIHACASYDNNSADTCTGAADAIPGTPSKCGCKLVNLPFTPTNITLGNSSISETSSPWLPLLGAVALLAAATFLILRQRSQSQTG